MRQMRQEAKKGVRFAGLRTYTVQSSCLPTTWSTLYGAHKDIELVRELPARDAEVFLRQRRCRRQASGLKISSRVLTMTCLLMAIAMAQ